MTTTNFNTELEKRAEERMTLKDMGLNPNGKNTFAWAKIYVRRARDLDRSGEWAYDINDDARERRLQAARIADARLGRNMSEAERYYAMKGGNFYGPKNAKLEAFKEAYRVREAAREIRFREAMKAEGKTAPARLAAKTSMTTKDWGKAYGIFKD